MHSEDYKSQLTSDLSSIDIVVDNSRRGQLLEAEIREGINPSLIESEKLYTLKITLNEREIPLFINPDGTSSRGDIEYISTYVLQRKQDAKPIQTGTISRVASYNSFLNSNNPALRDKLYASYVSLEDAKTRGIIELAQAYKLRLSNLVPALNGNGVPATNPAPVIDTIPYPHLLRP